LHTNNYGYGWGIFLNERVEARGFWSAEDEQHHIAWKDQKAVRHAVESFLMQLAGYNVLVHDDNQTICYIMASLTLTCDDGGITVALVLLDTNNITYEHVTSSEQPTYGPTVSADTSTTATAS
jgi:hypothetical protein